VVGVAAVEEDSNCWVGIVVGCRLCMAGNSSQCASAGCRGVGGSVEK
jgi:hypothetical protein